MMATGFSGSRFAMMMMMIQSNSLIAQFQSDLLFCNPTPEIVRVGPPDVPLVVGDAHSVRFKWWMREEGGRFGVEQPGTESLLAGRTPPSLARLRSKLLPDVTKTREPPSERTTTRRDGNIFCGSESRKKEKKEKSLGRSFLVFFSPSRRRRDSAGFHRGPRRSRDKETKRPRSEELVPLPAGCVRAPRWVGGPGRF